MRNSATVASSLIAGAICSTAAAARRRSASRSFASLRAGLLPSVSSPRSPGHTTARVHTATTRPRFRRDQGDRQQLVFGCCRRLVLGLCRRQRPRHRLRPRMLMATAHWRRVMAAVPRGPQVGAGITMARGRSCTGAAAGCCVATADGCAVTAIGCGAASPAATLAGQGSARPS